MNYCSIVDGNLVQANKLQPGTKLFKHHLKLLLPPLITKLHQSFYAWGVAGLSPGPLLIQRVYFNAHGELAFHFPDGSVPLPLTTAGLAPSLAAWFVMLDKWMETYVVLARARTVWHIDELCSALTFLTPAFLPDKLVAHPPDNWERVAQALAIVVADGSLTSESIELL